MTPNAAVPGVFFALFFGFFFIVGILSLILLVVSIVDMARRPDWQWKLAGQEKVLWIVLVCLVNVLAIPSLIYWFNIRRKLIAVEQAAGAGYYGPGFMTATGWQPGPVAPNAWPPGWYPDPTGGYERRWWDGVGWTQHTQGQERAHPPS